MSAKKQKEKRETDGPRKDYVREIGRCFCGKPTQQCHEIGAGSHRHNSVRYRFAWIAFCKWGGCHDRWQGKKFRYQYALKKHQDPDGYSREALNKLLRPNGTGFVDEEEVELAYQELKRKGVLK